MQKNKINRFILAICLSAFFFGCSAHKKRDEYHILKKEIERYLKNKRIASALYLTNDFCIKYSPPNNYWIDRGGRNFIWLLDVKNKNQLDLLWNELVANQKKNPTNTDGPHAIAIENYRHNDSSKKYKLPEIHFMVNDELWGDFEAHFQAQIETLYCDLMKKALIMTVDMPRGFFEGGLASTGTLFFFNEKKAVMIGCYWHINKK